jgi:uncharacterized lipoprotein YmbA
MKRYGESWLVLLLCMSACSSGPPLRTYILTPPLALGPLAPAPASSNERIVVRGVLVPDYLDTTDILLRDGDNEVKLSASGRWSERLSQGLTRALATDLQMRLPAGTVVLDRSSPAQRQVLINVTSLDLWREGRCALAATWTIVDRDASRAVATGSGTFYSSAMGSTTDVGDARLVEAISRTLGELADAITLKMPQGGDARVSYAD